MAKDCARPVTFGTCEGWYPLMHWYPVAAPQAPPRMFCHPSILPPSIAATSDATLCVTLGTVSGLVLGLTITPFDRVTDDGIPPSGQRPGSSSHQNPSTESNE